MEIFKTFFNIPLYLNQRFNFWYEFFLLLSTKTLAFKILNNFLVGTKSGWIQILFIVNLVIHLFFVKAPVQTFEIRVMIILIKRIIIIIDKIHEKLLLIGSKKVLFFFCSEKIKVYQQKTFLSNNLKQI